MRLWHTLLPLLLVAPALAEASPPVSYVALGDSFTIGTGSAPERSFPARLAQLWHVTKLTNLGVNGYTTDDVIDAELPALPGLKADLVTLAIGANDIVRGNSPETYRAHARAILAAIRQAGVPPARILVLPQPDWSLSPVAAAFGSPAKLGRLIEAYNQILHDEASSAGARWIDLYPLMHREAQQGMIAGDGLHPAAQAYEAWAEEISKARLQ